jgi:2-C-methyl-D-erythritol 2,4-cyclodiphosphate synthase
MRIGFGYDIHRFAPNRKLVLGGVEFQYPVGLLGHSDADVLLHAIADALLGAAALGDIGVHFPPDSPEFEGISSMVLLRRTTELLKAAGYRPVNIDATIIAEKPRVMSKAGRMRQNIAECVSLDIGDVNVKATTNEGLGAIGAGEGICAHAVALIEKI